MIRATGGQNTNRWIAVPSYQSSPGLALSDDFKIPDDASKRLIVAVHCYDPYDFTLRNPLSSSWGSEADKLAITNLLNQLKAKFIDQNIPCYLGEFGCSRHTTEEENRIRDYYLEYFCRAAHFLPLGQPQSRRGFRASCILLPQGWFVAGWQRKSRQDDD